MISTGNTRNRSWVRTRTSRTHEQRYATAKVKVHKCLTAARNWKSAEESPIPERIRKLLRLATTCKDSILAFVAEAREQNALLIAVLKRAVQRKGVDRNRKRRALRDAMTLQAMLVDAITRMTSAGRLAYT